MINTINEISITIYAIIFYVLINTIFSYDKFSAVISQNFKLNKMVVQSIMFGLLFFVGFNIYFNIYQLDEQFTIGAQAPSWANHPWVSESEGSGA